MLYILGPLMLIASALLQIAANQEKETERQIIADRVALIEQAKNSDNPEIIASAKMAEQEVKAIREQAQRKKKEQEYQASLKPYERPSTWIMIIVTLLSILLLPYIYYKALSGRSY